MKLFLAVAALVNADQDVSIPESCIIAPADGQKLQSTSWGPIWKKLTSCTNDPKLSADGKYWKISVGTKCTKVFCNLKTGGSVAKYREFTCVDQDKLEVQDWYKKVWNFDASGGENFLCPTVREAGCQWNADNPTGLFVLPAAPEQMQGAAAAAINGESYSCNRDARFGWDALNKLGKDAMKDVNGGLYMFQKRKFDVYCDKFYPDKKRKGFFTKKPKMKSGTRATCLCGAKASGGEIKAMFADIDAGATINSLQWKPLNCAFKATNRLFGKTENVYDLGTKGQCDNGQFVNEEGGSGYIMDTSIGSSCCAKDTCPENSKCFQYSPTILPDTIPSPFWGSGFECQCDPGYEFDADGNCFQTDPCMINNGGCSKFADCTSELLEDGTTPFECKCKDGYLGDGFTCAPESCDVDNGWCNENAACSQNDDGSFNCECNADAWFTGDGHGFDGCTYDPCGMGYCDDNAGCGVQDDNSVLCKCNPGFFGDGKSCAHVCTDNNLSGCSADAICTPMENGHMCTCANGYEGDGRTCICPEGKGEVTDETGLTGCYDTHPDIVCGENQSWSWIEWSCICSDGFEAGVSEGSGDSESDSDLTCIDINECATITLPDSVGCENTFGSYQLFCIDGYEEVEGFETEGCADIDECALGTHLCNCPVFCMGIDVCPDPLCDSKCFNTDGGYGCDCSEGFQIGSDGISCEDTDECDLGTHLCEVGEACINGVGTYACTCAEGWETNSTIACDECKFGFHDCHADAECFDEEEGFSCQCNFGYSDAFENANGTDCKQDGDWAPLRVKAFEQGLSDAIRSGVQNEQERSVQWPELPADYGCAVKPWDRDHAGYIELFNSLIKKHKKFYKGPNVKDDDWEEQVSFPVPETTWSWGTWGEWGEWSVTCTRKDSECKAKNRGWQTRERKCIVDGQSVCSSWCMPVDDMGLTPMESDRKKYPFTQRIDRETEENKDLWWVDPTSGKKVKSYSFEEPFNPYLEGDTNSLWDDHKAMYNECRDTGSFLLAAASIPTEKDENGEWIKNWSPEHPADYMEARKKTTDDERFICTHQWRSCEDIAEWVHEDSTGSTVAGWTEWSECFAQREETKCMNSGHTSGNFAAPYNLETHHYQQRTRKCSTGCFADCIGLTDPDFANFDSTQMFIAWRKVGDINTDWATRKAVMWRACHHRTGSYGCSIAPFGGWKSHINLSARCSWVPDEDSRFNARGFFFAQAGMMGENTVCTDVFSSMNPMDKAPFWDTKSVPNTSANQVDIKCVCEGGCNQCEWQIVSPQKVLGVDEELPPVSHANGFMQDYTFVPAVKHKWDTEWAEVESNAVRFWDEDDFNWDEMYKSDRQGDYMCIGSKLKSKWQFGNMFNSVYHNVLYNPARDNEWYNWNQHMCRYALRFGSTYEYFTEEHFQILQVADKSKIKWVEANDFLTQNYDVSQIVTAADSDTMDANEDETEEIQYAGDLANWRIAGACRIVKKCTRTMTKQFANGRTEIPCVREDQIYNVQMGSLRLYENGEYATASTNATAPKFCCKEINYLHWAEPHLWGADVGINHNEDKTIDDTRGILDFIREEPLSAMDQMISQDVRNQDRGIGDPTAHVIDDSKRDCYNHHIQIMVLNERPSFTHWSAWSGCSVSCGVLQEDGTYKGGVQTRTRVPIVQKFNENGLHEPKYQNNDAETETRECHNFECHTTHWGQWEEWGKCTKNKKKNTEKWQKRRRTCMYQGRPLDEWKDEGLIPKGTDTREKENCPKEDWEDWQCCCEETVCTRKNGNSLCPWDPSFAQFRPV